MAKLRRDDQEDSRNRELIAHIEAEYAGTIRNKPEFSSLTHELRYQTVHSLHMANTQSKYISIGQAAAVLGVPKAWLKREADAGRLSCLRVGRRYMFLLEVVRLELDQRAESEPLNGGQA